MVFCSIIAVTSLEGGRTGLKYLGGWGGVGCLTFFTGTSVPEEGKEQPSTCEPERGEKSSFHLSLPNGLDEDSWGREKYWSEEEEGEMH